MVVMLLIGIITAMGLPRFLRSPVPITQQFMHKLNTLVAQAAEQAQQEAEPRRILFNLAARSVEIQTIRARRLGSQLTIPDVIEVSDVIINGVSQFKIGGGAKRTFYFLINAEGVSQQVELILNERTSSGVRTYDFSLNPFTSLFRVK